MEVKAEQERLENERFIAEAKEQEERMRQEAAERLRLEQEE